MEQPPGRTGIAVDGDTVVGSAKMGPNRPGRGSHVATASFLVDPAFQGRGVGRALGSYVIDWARTTGYHSIQFNAVVETNSGQATPAITITKTRGASRRSAGTGCAGSTARSATAHPPPRHRAVVRIAPPGPAAAAPHRCASGPRL